MRKLFIGAMLLGAAMVSCSESGDMEGAPSTAPSNNSAVKINTAVSATRGTNTTTSTLETDGEIKLHYQSSKGTNGMFPYTYASGNGSWSTTAANSTWADLGFPTSFFSLHNGTDAQTLTNNGGGTATIYYDNSVNPYESTNTKDLVYYAGKIESMPVGGAITALHKHALSKLNFSSSVGTANEKVYISSVKLKNVASIGDLTLKAEDGTAEWSDQGTSSSYNYFANTNPTTANAQLSTSNNALLMIPQTTEAYEPLASASTETYIEVIYYLTDEDGTPVVGFPNASKCKLGFQTADASQSGLSADEPIYLKVAFPMAYTFEMGTQYDITLGFDSANSTGGYIIEQNYCDESGNEITLKDASGNPIPFPKSIGDTAIDSTSAQVGLYVAAVEWGDDKENVSIDDLLFWDSITSTTKTDTLTPNHATDNIGKITPISITINATKRIGWEFVSVDNNDLKPHVESSIGYSEGISLEEWSTPYTVDADTKINYEVYQTYTEYTYTLGEESVVVKVWNDDVWYEITNEEQGDMRDDGII